MMIRFERPVSHAARLARRFSYLGFLLTVVALGTHRFGLISTPYMVALVAVGAVLAATAVILALIGLQRLWQVGAEGGYAALKALIAAVLPLTLAANTALHWQKAPPVWEVSSDRPSPPEWIDPPQADQFFFPARAGAAPVSAEAEPYPDLTGRRYEGAMDRIYRAVAKVAKAEHITIVADKGLDNATVDLEDSVVEVKPNQVPAEDAPEKPAETPEVGPIPRERPDLAGGFAFPRQDVLLQGEKRSFILGLPFDVAIRLRENAETTSVDLRVAARYGPREMGMAAEIADSFFKALDAELLGIAGN